MGEPESEEHGVLGKGEQRVPWRGKNGVPVMGKHGGPEMGEHGVLEIGEHGAPFRHVERHSPGAISVCQAHHKMRPTWPYVLTS